MALVVVDGETASMKALELCCVPGVLVKQQDKEQLVIVHVWKDHIDHHTAAANSNGGVGGGSSVNGGIDGSTLSTGGAASPSGGGGNRLPPTGTPASAALLQQQQAAAAAAAAAINPQTVMQNAMTVATTVNYILGNRYAQSGLNYKIETMRLQQPPESLFGHSNSVMGGTIGGGANSPSARATPGPGATSPSSQQKKGSVALNNSTLNGGNKTAAAAASAAAANIEAASAVDADGSPAGPSPAELAQQKLAAEVSSYAFLRARHHHRKLLVFGVGNKLNEKKHHTIGNSAKAMMDLMYNTISNSAANSSSGGGDQQRNKMFGSGACVNLVNGFNLPEGFATSKAIARTPQPRLNALAVKSTGTTIRPTSTIKYLVLLQLEYAFAEGDVGTSEVNHEGTTVVHAPAPISAKLSASSKTALKVLAEYVRKQQKAPPTPTLAEGETMLDEATLAAHAAAVAAAAAQPFDDIGCLIIANDNIPMTVAPQPTHDANGNPIKRPKNYVPPALITISDVVTPEYLDDLIRPVMDEFLEWTIENNMEKRGSDDDHGTDGDVASGGGERRNGGGTDSEAEGGGNSGSPTTTTATASAPTATAGGGQQIPLLPLFTKVFLEPSRDVPHYPLNAFNAPTQYAKAVNSIKPDILVVPSSIPRPAVEAILALPKPHVLICGE